MEDTSIYQQRVRARGIPTLQYDDVPSSPTPFSVPFEREPGRLASTYRPHDDRLSSSECGRKSSPPMTNEERRRLEKDGKYAAVVRARELRVKYDPNRLSRSRSQSPSPEFRREYDRDYNQDSSRAPIPERLRSCRWQNDLFERLDFPPRTQEVRLSCFDETEQVSGFPRKWTRL